MVDLVGDEIWRLLVVVVEVRRLLLVVIEVGRLLMVVVEATWEKRETLS